MFEKLIFPALLFAALPAGAAEVFRAGPIEGVFYRALFEEAFGDPHDQTQPEAFAERPHFRVEGRIEAGDTERLGLLLREELPDFNVDMFNQVVVSFASDGGDFYEGLKIADLVSDYMVSTIVLPGDRCLSSCAIAFMGGSDLMMRGFPAWPSRFLSDEALLGFHAPFSELPSAIQLPEGTPLSAPLMAQITNQFYGQAQAAINEIAGRMDDWQMAPDFVFALLTKASLVNDDRPLQDRFVFVQSYGTALDTKTTVLTSELRRPRSITAVGAGNACSYLWHTATRRFHLAFWQLTDWRAFDQDDVIADRGSFDPEGFMFAGFEGARQRYPAILEKPQVPSYLSKLRRLFPGTDPDAYYFSIPNPGQGIVECAVYRDADGVWRARTHNQNVHFPESDGKYSAGRGAELVRTTVLDFDDGYPITEHMLLGVHGRWGDNGPLVSDDTLDLPADIAAIADASFDCGGALDPAAEVICAYPALAAADGRMGALYRLARQVDPDRARADQRAWVAVRNRVCKPGEIDLTRPIQNRNLAECLLDFTQGRVAELARSL